MNSEQAHKIYDENWCPDYTTMEQLFERIKTLSENGAYTMCVYIDSREEYDAVYSELRGLDYTVEHYNGGDNNILEISW